NSTYNTTSTSLHFIVKKRNADECLNPLCALKTPADGGTAETVLCGIAHTLTNITNMVWFKGCNFFTQSGSHLRFRELSDTDSGNYTCVVTLTRGGKSYNYTKTTQLIVKDPVEIVNPHILESDSISYETVDIGLPYTLQCKGFISHENDHSDAITLYWIKKKAEDSLGSADFLTMCTNETWEAPCETETKFNYSNGNAFLSNEIRFQEVKEEDFEFNYICKLDSPSGNKKKTFVLRRKGQSDIAQRTFATGITLATVLPSLFLLMCVVCYAFRIDLVLWHRRLTNKDETKSDGKEYDAYVSYLKYSKIDAEAERKFALDVLSHTLEEHFGYKLCIFERDVMPGG
ncbi:hypothetical protein NDU88_006511, partial [Pleurodeles waltl]